MLVVLRKEVEDGRGLMAKVGASIIRARIVSDYYHAGIVIGGRLIHSTAADGLHDVPYFPTGWVAYDLGTDRDAEVLALYEKLKGAGYDWFSLLAFVLPGRISDARRWYCFEWVLYCLTGVIPTTRITPETLLTQIIAAGGIKK
jgi:hypothetical protein